MNRGNARSAIFHKPEDYEALEQILAEGLTRYACRILAYELMPNHWHFVLQPTEDGGMSNFLRWVSLTHTMRLHDHYRTGESDQCLERSVPGTNYQKPTGRFGFRRRRLWQTVQLVRGLPDRGLVDGVCRPN